jgi:hypothetical protein
VEIETTRPLPVSIESKLVGVTPARFTVHTGALSVITGAGDGLLNPPSTALVRASASAALALESVPSSNGHDTAAPQLAQHPASGFLQALAPAAGHVLDAASSARSIAIPLLAGALGVAAASLLRPRAKSIFH